jgi:hypothetical protein
MEKKRGEGNEGMKGARVSKWVVGERQAWEWSVVSGQWVGVVGGSGGKGSGRSSSWVVWPGLCALVLWCFGAFG